MNFEEDNLDSTSESIFLDSNSEISSDTSTNTSEWIDQNCPNESPVTLSKFTPQDHVFKLFIRKGGSHFTTGVCISRDELSETIVSDKTSDIPSYIQCIYTPTNNPVGYGGKPTFRLVVRILGPNIFVTIGSIRRVLTSNVTNWYAVDMFGGKRRRIGNLLGSFGPSLNHGQVPGFKVYKLFTRDELESGVIAEETLDDYILFQEQTALLPFLNGHSGYGGLSTFVAKVIDTLVGIDFLEQLQKWKIEYTDPTNFIYIMNDTSIESVKNPDESYDFEKIYSLYMKFNSMREIFCTNKSITSIPIYPNVLKLYCHNNRLKEIHGYPNLQTLVCFDNQITSISPECPKLREIDTSRNLLTEIPEYPQLETLYCNDNGLVSLPNYPRIRKLECSKNRLSRIPIYIQLLSLVCSANFLTTLPNFPNLINCDCSNNIINTIMSSRSSNLTVLNCSNNRLSDIPFFRGLKKLYCDNNGLLSLRNYPMLTHLTCSNNSLIDLPNNLNNLQVLDCRKNKITRLGTFNNLICIDYDRDIIIADHLKHLPRCSQPRTLVIN
ncbi:hypothetical protein EB118_18645 [bacterium]|nr:hypothetical protein [bacterium]NDC95623.1 hypothetical protein [bacterium]NDD85344.1 hypothetical protein [bacterium]NDG32081.1 hypothetical protein [bacterium]